MIRCMLLVILAMTAAGCAARVPLAPAAEAPARAAGYGLLAAPDKGRVIDKGKIEVLFSAGDIQWELRRDGMEYGLWARNHTKVALTVDAGLTLTNMIDGGMPKTHVLEQGGGFRQVAAWHVQPGAKSYRWRWSLRYQPGTPDVALDQAYAYALPFPKGSTARVHTGWNMGSNKGPAAHRLSIELDPGTPVLASRDGQVVAIFDARLKAKHQPGDKQPNMGGWVFVRHDDGSIASYMGLDPHTLKVAVGQQLKRGGRIAEAGRPTVPGKTQILFALPGAVTGSEYRTYPFKWRVGPGADEVAEPVHRASYTGFEFTVGR